MNQASSTPVSREELDFIRDAHQTLASNKVGGAHILLWTILLTIAGLCYWASQAEIDEVTRGVGKVIPSASIQTVQNLEGGIISEITVSEGDHVKKGDVLVKIDDTQSSASYRENLTQAEALEATLARLHAEGTSEQPKFNSALAEKRPELIQREMDLYAKRHGELEKIQATLTENLELAANELNLTKPLAESGIVPEVEYLRLQREVNQLQGELSELAGQFQIEALRQANEVEAKLESLLQTLQGRQDRMARTIVRSPVDGVINNLHLRTIGGVLKPGEPIVDVVPHDEALMVEASIRPSDIAFLTQGQEAVLKFTAYDFAIYGGLNGVVEHISADTIEDEIDQKRYYQIKVRNTSGKLERDGKELPILPGMVVQVDVITGRRTVMQYLLKPFHRIRYSSLGER